MSIPIAKMALLGLLPSSLKAAYYRRQGARIGRGVKFGLFSVLLAEQIEIGDDTVIGPLSFIRCRRLRLGNRVRIAAMVAIDTYDVKIGHDSVIMEQVVVGGMKTPRSRLEVGARVKIFPYCFLNPTEPIVIEDEVGVGGSNYLFTHGSWQPVIDGFPVGFGPITLRKGVWLPWRVFILPNVEVGEYATIGAGAVINKNIPARSLAVGAPAKVISADGAHLRLKSGDEQFAMVRDMMREMAEFMQFERAEVVVDDTAEVLHIDVTRAPRARQRVRLVRHATTADAAQAADVVVSFEAMAAQTLQALQSAGTTWFDIGTRQCTIGRSALFDAVRNYFSRFGIRFAVAGEVDI
jgi:acetyltransferase-like isoleucine patch superfamily enzyme